MTPEGLRKKIERETGLFLRLQTHKFKDSGPFSDWVYEGYLTVSTEQQILKASTATKTENAQQGFQRTSVSTITHQPMRRGLMSLATQSV